MTGAVIGGLIGSQFGGGAGQVMAAGVGAIAGACLGGQIGRTMDRQDQLEMQHALETGQAVSWCNPNGNRYSVRPTRNYYMSEQPCREYVTRAFIGGRSQEIYGRACRQADGSWRVMN